MSHKGARAAHMDALAPLFESYDPANIKYLYLTVYYRLSVMVLEIYRGLIWQPKLNPAATKLKKMVSSGSQRSVLEP